MSPTRTALSAPCTLSVQREKSKSLFKSVNSIRISNSLPPLTWDDTLYTYCVLHNIDMHSSKLKSSSFQLGQPYNENTAHAPSTSREETLALWKRGSERENVIFRDVKYSAVAVLGDDQESYATQIFTAHRPQKNERVPSMKTNKPCSSCAPGRTSSHAGSSVRAKTLATTRLHSKGKSLARTGASASKPSLFGFTQQSAAKPVTQALKHFGQSVVSGGQSLVAGLKSLGGAFDAPRDCPRGRTRGSSRLGSSSCARYRPHMSSGSSAIGRSSSAPRGLGRHRFSTAGCSSTARSAFGPCRMTYSSSSDDSYADCPICNNRRKRFMYCDTCTSSSRC